MLLYYCFYTIIFVLSYILLVVPFIVIIFPNCRDLERQHVQDKDAWKKNTAAQLKEMRERMQKLSENQLETLTKRTILENEAMAAELKYKSRQVNI